MANIAELLKSTEAAAFDLDGLGSLEQSLPIIFWRNDPMTFTENNADMPRPTVGGFIMTRDNIEAAEDYPKGATLNMVKFKGTQQNPAGDHVECRYTDTLMFVPMATRMAWFVDKFRVGKDFDFRQAKKDGIKMHSKRHFLALVWGEKAPFVALLTLSSNVAGEAEEALREHAKAARRMLRSEGVTNKPMLKHGWHYFWAMFQAGRIVSRGSGDNTSPGTQLIYKKTGEYMGNDLRAEFFDNSEAVEFEHSWDGEAMAGGDPMTPAPSTDYTAGEVDADGYPF